VNGSDYHLLASSITLPAGISSSNIAIIPYTNSLPVGDKTVTLSLAANAAYSIGSIAAATLTIYDVPLYDWRLQHFGTEATNAAIAGDGANPAGDGIPNLTKYALGLDPTRAVSAPLFALTLDPSGYFALSYTRPDPPPSDVGYQVESSVDLMTWCTNSSCTLVEQILLGSNYTTATVTSRNVVPISTSSQGFLRLRVTRQ
jgi:hypothetical protein